MGCKKKIAKTTSHTTKRPVQNIQRRRTKIKKRSRKFILDKRGDSRPSRFSFANKTRTKNTLGHDALIQKERELMVDLFGGGESVEQMEKHTDDQEERKQPEVKVKSEVKKQNLLPSIADDPFDIHHQDEEKQKTPAWIDEDDHNIRVKDVVAGMDKGRGSRGIREVSEEQYSHTLQQKFNQAMGVTPKWAHLHQPVGEDVEEVVLEKGTGDYLARGTSAKLDKKRIDFKKQVDLNHASHTEGAIITATEFNPKYHMALVAGFSSSVVGAASLFKVDGTYNHLIHSVKFPKFPIKYAKFLCDGGKFVVGSSQYNHFYMYDLEAAQETKIPSNLGRDGHNMKNVLVSPDGELLVFIGKNGQLHLFDADCLSLVDTLYASGDVTSAAFNSDGSRLYTHTTEGDVYIWDMHARACIHRFYDDGCIGGTSIAVSPNNLYLACGSSSGVVTVYDLANVMSRSPSPVKMLTRLRTTVSALAFNSSSEILAAASDQVENAIKLAHLPSMTYFENFPDPRSELRRINAVNFSPQTGFLAIGNNSGRAFLYRLHHFTSY
ncbi:hypothetical protein O3P69_020101 [Scylla paramamosain]|uniref:U3 small nucleolar RNA-associated protein 18-like protein n=1 Tax=Scylla paramamosain TaxID=85552 RepID=A0AAW0TMT6_SCYPA